MPSPNYRCPLCNSSLALKVKTYRCDNNHCFDQAKEGYVNLLPVQHKHSKSPGDNKTMVDARRAFLDKGYYQPLIDEITNLYQEFGDSKATILDAKKLIKNLESEKLKEESDNKLKEESTSRKETKKLKPEEESTSDKKSKK